jgi:hypothetical protein
MSLQDDNKVRKINITKSQCQMGHTRYSSPDQIESKRRNKIYRICSLASDQIEPIFSAMITSTDFTTVFENENEPPVTSLGSLTWRSISRLLLGV